MVRLVTYKHQESESIGSLLSDGSIVDLAAATRVRSLPFQAKTMLELLNSHQSLASARCVVAEAGTGALRDCTLLPGTYQLTAPIPRPARNIFCVGRNYREHVEEGFRARGEKTELPEYPQFFTKPPTTVIGIEDPIPLHARVTSQLDYEVELGVIIGRGGRDITADRAFEHVFGYTVVNDITARDLQRRHGQWFKGKSLDGTCVLGPTIVTRDEIPDPTALVLRLSVNGEPRQMSSVDAMIFPISIIIEALSAGMTLEVGDIIATGTPSGVGFAMIPPRFLCAGDTIEVEIDNVGKQISHVSDMP